jgi:hypothetical protein
MVANACGDFGGSSYAAAVNDLRGGIGSPRSTRLRERRPYLVSFGSAHLTLRRQLGLSLVVWQRETT